MWHRLVPMDEAMNVAGRRHGSLSAREKPGTSFKLLGIYLALPHWYPTFFQFFSRVRLDASASAAVEVNKNGLTSQMNKK